MPELSEIFQAKKPIIGMVHVKYRLGISEQEVVDCAMKDVESLQLGGADGLMIENWGLDYARTTIRRGEIRYLEAVLGAVQSTTKLPYGVNVLPFDYITDKYLADLHGGKFVHLDTFVDTVRTDYENRFVIHPDPVLVRRLLRNYLLMVNIQTKHYQTIPHNKKLEMSAKQAVKLGADVIVVTGVLTGKHPSKTKILRVRNEIGDSPLFIGSGLKTCNVRELMQYADGGIVGTGIKVDGITENLVDKDETKRFMGVIYEMR